MLCVYYRVSKLRKVMFRCWSNNLVDISINEYISLSLSSSQPHRRFLRVRRGHFDFWLIFLWRALAGLVQFGHSFLYRFFQLDVQFSTTENQETLSLTNKKNAKRIRRLKNTQINIRMWLMFQKTTKKLTFSPFFRLDGAIQSPRSTFAIDQS